SADPEFRPPFFFAVVRRAVDEKLIRTTLYTRFGPGFVSERTGFSKSRFKAVKRPIDVVFVIDDVPFHVLPPLGFGKLIQSRLLTVFFTTGSLSVHQVVCPSFLFAMTPASHKILV